MEPDELKRYDSFEPTIELDKNLTFSSIGPYLFKEKSGSNYMRLTFHVVHKDTLCDFTCDIFTQSRCERIIQVYSILGVNPHILCPHDVIYEDGKGFIITPICHGSLRSYVSIHGKLLEEKVRSFMKQICDSVNYCHLKNILHCDLGLYNFVFIDEDQTQIVLARFYVARLFNDSDSCNYRTKHVVKLRTPGNTHYVSYDMREFEVQATYDDNLRRISPLSYSGKLSDSWAIGAMLFVLCQGFHAFSLEDTFNSTVLYSHIYSKPIKITHRISPLCEDLIRHLLNRRNRLRCVDIKLHLHW